MMNFLNQFAGIELGEFPTVLRYYAQLQPQTTVSVLPSKSIVQTVENSEKKLSDGHVAPLDFQESEIVCPESGVRTVFCASLYWLVVPYIG
jgi:hypothetical protein